jgi:hypothetical protein
MDRRLATDRAAVTLRRRPPARPVQGAQTHVHLLSSRQLQRWADVGQKNWAVVRTVVTYHRYDPTAELSLLNKIWVLQWQMTKCFLAQQKLISKVRDGAMATKRYDVPTTRTGDPCGTRRSVPMTRRS